MRSFLGFIIVFVALKSGNAQYRAGHGAYCNKTVRCDSRAFLTCANETCQCLKETEMVFDSHRAKCVVLAGERCMYTAMESEGDDHQERRWAESLDCVDLADCNPDGYCGCGIESHETPEGRCVANKEYGGSCENDLQCRASQNLICVGGKCTCDAKEAIYDDYSGECIGKVGAFCGKYASCVPNAQRDNCGYGDLYDYCQCRDGFTKSEDGLCLGSYGSECNPKSSPCVRNLSCYNGHCDCRFPNYQEFDSTRGKCLSVLNGPCLETIRGEVFRYECAGAAECRNDNGINECLCKKGYIKSKGNTCKKAYGTACYKNDECDVVPGTVLFCKNGVCSCDDFQVYDEQSTKCFGLVGARCSVFPGCIENAFCKRQRTDPNSSSGICRCNPGAIVDSNRKCVLEVETEVVNGTTVGMIAEKIVEAVENDL